MNNEQKKRLDRYSMMIVSKYFKCIGDFIKLIKICKKYREIPEMYHYNPVKLMKKTKLFPSIETYHSYNKNEKRIEGYDNYVYWYRVSYDTYLKRKENEQFKNVRFTSYDWYLNKSFKGASFLKEGALSLCDFTEFDLTGITQLDKCCFKWGSHVKQIQLDKRISSIPDECFYGCSSLIELDLSNIKILGSYCFYGCSSLTALTLPEMLFKIGDNCFSGISELEKIEAKGMKLIEANMNYSLYKCFIRIGIDVKGIISYSSYDRIKYGNEIPEEISIINTHCFNGVTTIGDVLLPKAVTKLEYSCFCNCSIKSIDLSNVIENNCMFEGSNELTSLTLNKIFTEPPGNRYFQLYNYLTTLKNIELSDTNHIPIVTNHLRKLMNEKGYQYDCCIYTFYDRIETNSIIPDEVSVIKENVFNCQNELKSVTIPSNVTHICFDNFNTMSSLESIEIKSTNIQCDEKCFYYLPKIKELDLRGITLFGINCIYNCFSLTKLVIQNVPLEKGVIGCDSLKEIEIIGIENNEYEHPIDYKAGIILENKGIHCKTKVFNKYEQVENEETYCIPNGVDEIAPYAFNGSRLKEITIPPSITTVPPHTFYFCQHLTHLIIEGNPEIERNAIYACHQLIQNQPELKQYL